MTPPESNLILYEPKAEFDPAGANFSLTLAAGLHFIQDSDNSFVVRFGVGYELETSKAILTPLFVDLVYGLSFGFPFCKE